MFFSLPLNTHVNVSFFDQHQKTKSRLAYTSGVKKRTSYLFALILLAALLVLLALLTWRSPSAGRLVVPAHPANTLHYVEPISPLPTPIADPAPERSALGKLLFHDPALSADGSIACASCHILERAGTDGRNRAIGIGGAEGVRNTPSIFNSTYEVALFWDGRAKTLAEQVDGPLLHRHEMASNWPLVLQRLAANPDYQIRFTQLYPKGITRDNVIDALVHYQLTLISPNAPFDRYLRGERDAIDADAREGYSRFKAYGCASCHQGVNVGGNMFQRFGIMNDLFAGQDHADPGRFLVTGKEADRYVFKVPSLRNVVLTAPYFHDGSAERLEDAIAIMGLSQLGRHLTEEDIRLIAAFLATLTGQISDGTQVLPPP